MAILRRRLSRILSTVRALDALGKGCAEEGEVPQSSLEALPEMADVAAIGTL